jgi:hypothetical protein
VPDDRMIILDLNSEADPLWATFVANGKPFVWNVLHNYGAAAHTLRGAWLTYRLMMGWGGDGGDRGAEGSVR